MDLDTFINIRIFIFQKNEKFLTIISYNINGKIDKV